MGLSFKPPLAYCTVWYSKIQRIIKNAAIVRIRNIQYIYHITVAGYLTSCYTKYSLPNMTSETRDKVKKKVEPYGKKQARTRYGRNNGVLWKRMRDIHLACTMR